MENVSVELHGLSRNDRSTVRRTMKSLGLLDQGDRPTPRLSRACSVDTRRMALREAFEDYYGPLLEVGLPLEPSVLDRWLRDKGATDSTVNMARALAANIAREAGLGELTTRRRPGAITSSALSLSQVEQILVEQILHTTAMSDDTDTRFELHRFAAARLDLLRERQQADEGRDS